MACYALAENCSLASSRSLSLFHEFSNDLVVVGCRTQHTQKETFPLLMTSSALCSSSSWFFVFRHPPTDRSMKFFLFPRNFSETLLDNPYASNLDVNLRTIEYLFSVGGKCKLNNHLTCEILKTQTGEQFALWLDNKLERDLFYCNNFQSSITSRKTKNFPGKTTLPILSAELVVFPSRLIRVCACLLAS